MMIKIFFYIVMSAIVMHAQEVTAVYENVNVFGGYDKPVVIAILEFEGGGGIGGRLYEELNKIGELKEEFEFNAHEFLWKNRQILKVSNLNAGEKRVREALREVLGVSLIVTVESKSSEEFIMRIIETQNGREVYSCDYKRSKNSTGIKDAVRLFSDNQRTEYREKPKVNLDNMVYVEEGEFKMGSERGENDERPEHKVYVSSFYIGKYEVTQREYEEVMGKNPSYFKGDDLPVERVTWEEAVEYCEKLSEKTGKNYRLPTEAEWEYAARGGKESRRYEYSGSNNLDEIGWYNNNSGGKTHPVGTKKANELGIYDMSGNVWEWCSDWYSDNYYNNSIKNNPKGPDSGTYRVLRGGSWSYCDDFCRVANRVRDSPGGRSNGNGFRVVSTD